MISLAAPRPEAKLQLKPEAFKPILITCLNQNGVISKESELLPDSGLRFAYIVDS